ncbi:MAG TPA: hypothetical protein EYG69_05075 [Campylobacterales bacterium]|nr:hypothetical protein [Campylobacterales bacterium]
MNKLLILLLGLNLFGGDFFYEYGKKVEVTPTPNHLRSIDFNEGGIRYYTTKNGKQFGLKHEIILKLKNKTNDAHFFASYSITNAKKIATKTYLIKLDEKQDIFEFSQTLHNNPNTVYAVPNKIQKVEKR